MRREEKNTLIAVPDHWKTSSSVVLNLVAYLRTPAQHIPGFGQMMVDLLGEWVDVESGTNLIPFYDDIGGSYAPPQNMLDPVSMYRAKQELFDVMNGSSQKNLEERKNQCVDKINAMRNVYITWFYDKERMNEIATYLNFMVQSSAYDSTGDKKMKEGLIVLFNEVALMTKRRGDKWVDDIDAFVEYWEK